MKNRAMLLMMNRQYFLALSSLWFLILNNLCGALSTPPNTPASTTTTTTTTNHGNNNNHHYRKPKIIPITVISGFLGSGKTTLLQEMLQNKQGIKIAVVVNDVASVNIDSKLVSGSNSADGMVQLSNGCACCSLEGELLGSVSELVTMSDIRGESDGFDHIVVELSGVADPKGVRAQFQEAIFYDMPIMERVRLDTMITVVDCSAFLKYLQSSKVATPQQTPELFYREGEEIPEETEDDEWMKGMPPLLLEALLAGDKAAAINAASQQEANAVSDLLVSQTETADIVILNKIDLADDSGQDMDTINQIVSALNPKAIVEKTSFGKLPLDKVLAVAGGKGVVEAGLVDDHRDAITAAEQRSINNKPNDNKPSDCLDPDCTDNTHSHSHHDHSHSHSHNHDRSDPDCTDDSHNHATTCNDPDCTDTSHSHSHAHHDHDATTTLVQLGIGSFVYRARRPFHPKKLVAFLRHLPISRGLPENVEDEPCLQISNEAQEALQRVVRSKGFVWLGDSNVAANYWSHAGTSFELQCLGRWWSTLPRPEWPSEAVATILSDFDDPNHSEEDPVGDSVGDRRQEVVFIGPGLLREDRKADITASLNQCLLDDKEWEEYKEKKADETFLRKTYSNSLASKMLSY